MKSTLILSTLLLCLLFSCKKKSEDVPAVQNTYLSKLVHHSLGSFAYAYDAQNRLATEVFTSLDENVNSSSTYKVLKYNASGAIEEASYDYVAPARIDYKIVNTFAVDGRTSRTDAYNLQTGALQYYLVAIYTASSIRVNSFNAAGVLTSYYLYTLTADGKNYTKLESFTGSNVLSFSDTYSDYDTQKTFESLYPIGFSIYPSRVNNVLKDISIQGNTTTIFNFTYEYNADGYVTKKTNTATGKAVVYEYIKR
jgi:hypothetical protein